MAKVTGLGGAFLRADNPKELHEWYAQHLGITYAHGTLTFPAGPQKAKSVLSFFPRSSSYFPATQPAMLNLQVDDLDALYEKLSAAGVNVDPKREQHEYGRFAWLTDPEGNRVELWEPPA